MPEGTEGTGQGETSGEQGAGGGTSGQGSTGEGSGSTSTGEGAASKTYDETYVKSLRDESAKHRREARDVAAKLKALEDAQLSDTQKKDRDLEELRKSNTALQQVARNSAIEAVAASMKAQHPDAVAKLCPTDLDPTDRVAVTKAVEDVKKLYPALFNVQVGNGSADGAAGNNSDVKPGMNSFIRQAAGY